MSLHSQLLNVATGIWSPLSKSMYPNRLSILIYHRVLDSPDPLRPHEPTLETFTWQMELVARHFNPLPFSRALKLMGDNSLPDRALCVTFDDGYADNERVALPVLQRFGIPATVFVASGFLNGGCMWNDVLIESVRALRGQQLDLRDQGLTLYNLSSPPEAVSSLNRLLSDVKHLPPRQRAAIVDHVQAESGKVSPQLMLTDLQLRNLHQNGVEIGGHTVNHNILANLEREEARAAIFDDKARLESLLDSELNFFAYPNGIPGKDFHGEHIEMVKAAGYRAACSTCWGAGSTESDRWQLPRFTPWDQSPLKFGLRLLLNYRQLVTSGSPVSTA